MLIRRPQTKKGKRVLLRNLVGDFRNISRCSSGMPCDPEPESPNHENSKPEIPKTAASGAPKCVEPWGTESIGYASSEPQKVGTWVKGDQSARIPYTLL